jgi:hypothetical protein
VSVDSGERLYVCSADLQNAFYTLSMPGELRRYFGLQRVKARDLGLKEVDGVTVTGDTWIQPRVAVLPMGWSWALYWCQLIHERVAERSGLTSEERLQDFKAAPSGKFWHIQYVDNLHVLGTDRGEVVRRFRSAVEELKACGLTVHEVEECETSSKILGWEFDENGNFRPSRHRIWRRRMAIRHVLRRGRISGSQLERLLGHIAFASLGKREMFSMLGECYTFVQRHHGYEAPLWKSVRKELSCWESLAPLIVQKLGSDWSQNVLAVDASEWGLGVVASSFTRHEVKQYSNFNERWRFKEQLTSNARKFTFLEDDKIRSAVLEDDIPEHDPNMSVHVASMPFSAVDREWKVVGRVQWQEVESMPVLEARATLFGVRHLLRKLENHGCRLLILTDSMTAACAFAKGRAQTWRLRSVVQKVSALLLATGSSLTLRWVPSEWNPSDGPSRGLRGPSRPSRERHGDPPNPAMRCPMEQTQEGEQVCEPAQTESDPAGEDSAPKDNLGHRCGGGDQRKKGEACKQAKGGRRRTERDRETEERFGEQSDAGALHLSVQGDGGLCSAMAAEDGDSRADRCHDSELLRTPLHGRGGYIHGQLRGGRTLLPPTRAQGESEPPKDDAGAERVAQAEPTQKQNADSLRGGSVVSDPSPDAGTGRSSFGVAPASTSTCGLQNIEGFGSEM